MKLKLIGMMMLVSLFSYASMAPRFSGELMDGTSTSLKKHLKEDKALLLCFWATWCVPCMEELSQIKAGIKKKPNLPLNILTVNVDTSDTTSDIKPAIRLHKIPFPVVLDPQHKIFKKYSKQANLPFSVLLSPEGKILEIFKGGDEAFFEEVTQKVQVALKGK